jgi:hypothetical protein|tara:strand:- start:2060 stop:2452 length:393 start_codon:yes stop_codon:yes gene_type:complete
MSNPSNENVLDSKLSEKEQKELRILNKKSNKLRKQIKKNDDPLNMSIREFMRNWADTTIYIMIDLTNFFNNLSRYKSHFNDIDDTNNWVSGISKMLKKLYSIFTKKQRTIYMGFTLILLSFALYVIQITS